MFKKLLLVPACVACLLLFSCQKETSIDSTVPTGNNGENGGNNGGGGGGASTSLTGEWKFLQLHVVSTSTAIMMPLNTKTITHTDYYTKDNKGSITFTGNTVTTTNLSYSIDTTISFEMYDNGNLVMEMDTPFTFTSPAANGSTTYSLIGTDSIYVGAGFMDMGGGQIPSQPGGFKYKVSGDTLIMTMPFNLNSSTTDQGITTNTVHVGMSESRFLKM